MLPMEPAGEIPGAMLHGRDLARPAADAEAGVIPRVPGGHGVPRIPGQPIGTASSRSPSCTMSSIARQ